MRLDGVLPPGVEVFAVISGFRHGWHVRTEVPEG